MIAQPRSSLPEVAPPVSLDKFLTSGTVTGADLILCMDSDNLEALQRQAPSPALFEKVRPLTKYCQKRSDTRVPDPYYGGQAGFENVLDIVEDACGGLLDYLKKAHRL